MTTGAGLAICTRGGIGELGEVGDGMFEAFALAGGSIAGSDGLPGVDTVMLLIVGVEESDSAVDISLGILPLRVGALRDGRFRGRGEVAATRGMSPAVRAWIRAVRSSACRAIF